MAYLRRLPSGLWQATVRLPSGRKTTRTDPLRKVVADWAREEETRLARGVWRDPRAGRTTIEQRWSTWRPARTLAANTLEIYDTAWKLRIRPHLGDWPMGRLTRGDVETWVARLLKDGHGPRVVQQSVSVLSALFSAAVRDGIVEHNPVRGTKSIPTPLRPPEWFTEEEARAIWRALDGDPAMRTLVRLGMFVGLRWGELAALRGDRVDWLRGSARIVATLDGVVERKYAKTRKSLRVVPIPPEVLAEMSRLMIGRPADDFVFVSPRGAPLREPNFIRRVWKPAIEAARWRDAEKVVRKVRYRPPHTMRHTCASWLVQAGVSLYEVQALLGHETPAMAARYAHLAPEAHTRVLDAWSSMAAGAPAAHEPGRPVVRIRGDGR
jgi:integrase